MINRDPLPPPGAYDWDSVDPMAFLNGRAGEARRGMAGLPHSGGTPERDYRGRAGYGIDAVEAGQVRPDQMLCPNCDAVAESDSVDIGVGTLVRGNFACEACGWIMPEPEPMPFIEDEP